MLVSVLSAAIESDLATPPPVPLPCRNRNSKPAGPEPTQQLLPSVSSMPCSVKCAEKLLCPLPPAPRLLARGCAELHQCLSRSSRSPQDLHKVQKVLLKVRLPHVLPEELPGCPPSLFDCSCILNAAHNYVDELRGLYYVRDLFWFEAIWRVFGEVLLCMSSLMASPVIDPFAVFTLLRNEVPFDTAIKLSPSAVDEAISTPSPSEPSMAHRRSNAPPCSARPLIATRRQE